MPPSAQLFDAARHDSGTQHDVIADARAIPGMSLCNRHVRERQKII